MQKRGSSAGRDTSAGGVLDGGTHFLFLGCHINVFRLCCGQAPESAQTGSFLFVAAIAAWRVPTSCPPELDFVLPRFACRESPSAVSWSWFIIPFIWQSQRTCVRLIFMEPSELGRAMQALRVNRKGGGSKRRILHDPKARYCLCVDCRKARGHYPAHLMETPKAKRPTPKKTKRQKEKLKILRPFY